MQSVVSETAQSLIDDVAALSAGCGRVIHRLVASRIERLAYACDVAGVLTNRQIQHRGRSLRDPFNIRASLRTLNDLS